MSRSLPAQVVRLADGAWAMPDSQGVWIGLLEGHIDSGWRSHLELIPAGSLDAVVRAINRSEPHHTPVLSISTDAGGVQVELAGGHLAVLDAAASARLQILCARPPAPPASPLHGPPLPHAVVLPVASTRAALRVFDTPVLGGDVRLTGLSAAPGAAAVLQLMSDRGPTTLLVPALPLLLAAAEATCDGTTVALHLVERSGRSSVVLLDAGSTGRAAADAQWLIPALCRRSADDVRSRFA